MIFVLFYRSFLKIIIPMEIDFSYGMEWNLFGMFNNIRFY